MDIKVGFLKGQFNKDTFTLNSYDCHMFYFLKNMINAPKLGITHIVLNMNDMISKKEVEKLDKYLRKVNVKIRTAGSMSEVLEILDEYQPRRYVKIGRNDTIFV